MIDAKEIAFYHHETPNVITASMPKHDKGVNDIDVISAVEDIDSDCNIDSWIFPTTDSGLNNLKTKDFIPIFFSQK